MTAAPSVADLPADPLLEGARTLAGHAGHAGLGRPVRDVTAYRGVLDPVDGHLVLCTAEDATPAYRLDALVRRAQEAGTAALRATADGTGQAAAVRRTAGRPAPDPRAVGRHGRPLPARPRSHPAGPRPRGDAGPHLSRTRSAGSPPARRGRS
ncbi:hypothetical protein [Streptomyces tendae]|uniref:hypothetical protein n=1 Tax=Streptomyces tendae TaxID=1932 RepID=UPI00367932A8